MSQVLIVDDDPNQRQLLTWEFSDEGYVVDTATDGREALPARLVQIEADFASVIEQYRPAAVGVEQLYSHYNHPRTSILMGHARGVILCAAAKAGVVVHDFSATEIKKHLTGNGRASKAQMQRAVRAALGLTETPEPNDVADALAAAWCCAHVVRKRAMEGARR